MQTFVVNCFVVIISSFSEIHMIYLIICVVVDPLAFGQLHGCPIVSEVMGDKTWYQTNTKHTKAQAMGIFRYLVRTYVQYHYNDVTMSVIAFQITSLTIVYSSVYSGRVQRKHQSSVLLAFVRGIHRIPVNSPHKGPVTRKMFPFDDVIMWDEIHIQTGLFSIYWLISRI